MQRVVVTGLGIVSSIGNRASEVVASLRGCRSGMVFMPEMKAFNYRCCVYAPVRDLEPERVPVHLRRVVSKAARFGLAAAQEAVDDAGLVPADLARPEAGVVVGTGGSGRSDDEPSPRPGWVDRAAAVKLPNSCPAADLAHYFGTQGRTVSLSAACATGLYNIGHAVDLLRWGLLEVCLCGAAEGDTWKSVGMLADGAYGMPVDWNDRPTEACRPFDRDRQGFVMSAGAGILVVETLEHAQNRGARCYGEIVGYGAANDGDDMFLPSGEGLRLAIGEAMRSAATLGVTEIDYINTHGTGTPPNDAVEAALIGDMFGRHPMVSSTKAISGHSQGATSAQEAVFTILMLHHGFASPTANLVNIAPECSGINHVQGLVERPLNTVMKLTAGLGGVNACLIVRKLDA